MCEASSGGVANDDIADVQDIPGSELGAFHGGCFDDDSRMIAQGVESSGRLLEQARRKFGRSRILIGSQHCYKKGRRVKCNVINVI